MKRFLTAISIIAAVIVAFAFAIVLSQSQVSAGPTDNVSGYAESVVEGGGLISMNCTNTGTCGDVDYGVNIDPITGNWSGKAWSGYHGWINFGASDFQSSICGARPSTDPATGETSGWAYMEAPQGASMDEHGAVTGCISMSGANYGVNVNLQTGAASGYAWSGYDITTDTTGDGTNDWTNNNIPNVGLGWIDFSSIIFQPDPTATTVFVTNSPNNICPGDNVSNATIQYNNAVECSVSGSVWNDSGNVFTSADPAITETDSLSLGLQAHTGTGQLSGTITCVGVPATQTASDSFTVNYLSSSDAQCQTPPPPPPCEPGEPCWCVENPTDAQCDICITNPNDPSCPNDPLCVWYPTHPSCRDCEDDSTLPQCAPEETGPIYIDTREQ